MKTTENFPLVKAQCSAQDVAEGIAAYYKQTGVELQFDEAFKMIEDGLRKREDEVFNNPEIIARFKSFHGLDASKKGKRSQLTLSSNLSAQPTKVAPEEMSDDEIIDYWKGKIYA